MQEPAWISSSLARLVSWDQQQAKAKFSEVVRRARSEGPQLVTTRGTKPVVILSAEDYVALTENRPKSFRDLLLPGEEDFQPLGERTDRNVVHDRAHGVTLISTDFVDRFQIRRSRRDRSLDKRIYASIIGT